MARWFRAVAVALALSLALHNGAGAQNPTFSFFEQYLDRLRVDAGIPGLSAAILHQGQVVWEAGLGQRDVESSSRARPDTPYNIGDLTQIFTTVLLAQCAERGNDDVQAGRLITEWIPLAPQPPATLRQYLSHTSGPTGVFKHDLARFALLTGVIEQCTTRPYRLALRREILDRLSMVDAVPGRDLTTLLPDGTPMFDESTVERYSALLRRAATPYRVDNRRRATRVDSQPMGIDAASGLIASVRDLATFDSALEENALIRANTMQETWQNVSVMVNGSAVAQPTTMGWFAQTYDGHRLIWQFSLVPDAYSGLILKVPSRGWTLILLANSDGLSAPFSLQNGDVTRSLFAQTFLKLLR